MVKIAAVVALLVLLPPPQATEPTVRIGLDQNAARVTVRSTVAFNVEGHLTRSAIFSNAPVVAAGAEATVVRRQDLPYRLLIQLDDDRVVVAPAQSRVRIALPATAAAARLQVDDRTYRGAIDVFTNSRNTLTVVNELPLEEYLLGVVRRLGFDHVLRVGQTDDRSMMVLVRSY